MSGVPQRPRVGWLARLRWFFFPPPSPCRFVLPTNWLDIFGGTVNRGVPSSQALGTTTVVRLDGDEARTVYWAMQEASRDPCEDESGPWQSGFALSFDEVKARYLAVALSPDLTLWSRQMNSQAGEVRFWWETHRLPKSAKAILSRRIPQGD